MQRTMLNVVVELQIALREVAANKWKSVTKTAKFISIFKDLRLTYQHLGKSIQLLVDEIMQVNHAELLALFKKSGSQIPKISIISAMIDDKLLGDLAKLLQSTPATEQREALDSTVATRMSDEGPADTGTVKIKSIPTTLLHTSVYDTDDQLKYALASPNLKTKSPNYLAYTHFGPAANPWREDALTIIINTFEILLRNKEKRASVQARNELTTDYLEAYEKTVRRETQVLRSKVVLVKMQELSAKMQSHHEYNEIYKKLSSSADSANDDLYATGEAICSLLDNLLISALQRIKLFPDEDTSHYLLHNHHTIL
jgi:hypothetical protein